MAILTVDPFAPSDLAAVIAIDGEVSGKGRPEFWHEYARHMDQSRGFFVARDGDEMAGFILGEIRCGEFGQRPCGWVLSIGVSPNKTRQGVGRRLLAALRSWLRRQSVRRMRTLVPLDRGALHRFFRTNGFAGGPYVQLEMEV